MEFIKKLEKKYPNKDSKTKEFFEDQVDIYTEKLETLWLKPKEEKSFAELKNIEQKIEDIFFTMQTDSEIIACLQKKFDDKLFELSLNKVRAYEHLNLKKEATKLHNRIASIEKNNSEFTTISQTEEEIILEMDKKHATFKEMKDFCPFPE